MDTPVGNKNNLVGGWTNPSEKYAKVKLDHFPKVFGMQIKPIIWVATT